MPFRYLTKQHNTLLFRQTVWEVTRSIRITLTHTYTRPQSSNTFSLTAARNRTSFSFDLPSLHSLLPHCWKHGGHFGFMPSYPPDVISFSFYFFPFLSVSFYSFYYLPSLVHLISLYDQSLYAEVRPTWCILFYYILLILYAEVRPIQEVCGTCQ